MELMNLKYLIELKDHLRNPCNQGDLVKVNYCISKKGLYTMDFANTSNKCVIGGGDGICLMLAVIPNKDQ